MYIGWTVFVVVAAFSIVHAIVKLRRHERATSAWPRVMAHVTGHIKGWSNGAGGGTRNVRYFPAYQFVDPNGTLFAGQSEIPQGEMPALGSTIPVAYNPLNPNQSVHLSAKTRRTLGCAIPFMVAIAWAFFAFIGIFPE